MIYSYFELLWLFFIYSFIGWVAETAAEAAKQKKFVNKGVVNLPLNILSGTIAVFLTVFCYELQGIWLVIAAVLISSVFTWTAGHLIERIYHEKWWDYSNEKWNLDGYVSVYVSGCYGIASVIMMRWGNRLLIDLFRMIPSVVRDVLIWGLVVLLMLDIVATLLVMSAASRHTAYWESIDKKIDRYTYRLVDYIYSRVNRRIERAYPNAKKVDRTRPDTEVFAYGCSFYKIVWIFVIGSILGDITETIFCRVTAGVWMSRSSLVWGPFSIVWGFAMAAATILLYRYRDKSDSVLFLAGTFLGGVYEYVCSVLAELVFGKVFWDYSHMKFNLGGRINLLYCFFWGIAAVVWIKFLYPAMSGWIEKISVKTGRIMTWIFVVFMCCNMAVSAMALIRSTQRQDGVPAGQAWQQMMDERFDDERMEKIYPNAKEVKK